MQPEIIFCPTMRSRPDAHSRNNDMTNAKKSRFKVIHPSGPGQTTEQVVGQVSELIKREELKPGDRLPPERELAKQLGISRRYHSSTSHKYQGDQPKRKHRELPYNVVCYVSFHSPPMRRYQKRMDIMKAASWSTVSPRH